ncbi:hypothetical protein AURDEDRAFT_130864 [Auricularia subglabra TFB-10046 SS5]|nr:hypothetical protein AURDEDRAFT_130864 [Auricularia subglabra TFB-10046 SS5]
MTGPNDFPLDLPDDEEGQREVLARLQRWREVTMEGLGEIQLGERCEFEYDRDLDPGKHRVDPGYERNQPRCGSSPGGCKHFSKSWEPLPRPLPTIFRAGTCRHISITEELHVGENKNSQVFAGILGDSLQDDSSVPVAVKIYRPSQMPERCWRPLQRTPVHGVHVCVEMNSFKREYWAYKKLASLQGTVVPHLYGFFEFQFHDEPCIALVMELIGAYKAEEYRTVARKEGTDTVKAFCNGLAMATHAVHTCGLSMHDFAARNILVPRDHPTFPILVDFADAGNINEKGLQFSPSYIEWAATKMGFDPEKVEEWLKLSRDDPTFIVLFDLPPLEVRKAAEEKSRSARM